MIGDAFAVVAGFRDDSVLWVRAAAIRSVSGLTRAAPGYLVDRSILPVDHGRVDIGVAVYSNCDGLTPPELGRAVEERGFESLFWTEHTHIPAHSRRTSGGPTRGYAETIDPFVALAAVAAVTTP